MLLLRINIEILYVQQYRPTCKESMYFVLDRYHFTLYNFKNQINSELLLKINQRKEVTLKCINACIWNYIVLTLTKQQYLVMCQPLSVEKDHLAFSSHNQQSSCSTSDEVPFTATLFASPPLTVMHKKWTLHCPPWGIWCHNYDLFITVE